MLLSQNIWENKVRQSNLYTWLDNFTSSGNIKNCERTHALYLLSNYMYFGSREIRELLKSLYRDKFYRPILQDIRKKNNDTKDAVLIQNIFSIEKKKTRFLGIGNPSESGAFLLYYFRQENNLDINDFISTNDILYFDEDKKKFSLRDSSIRRYILLDDICGSGTQAIEYSQELVSKIKKIDKNIEVYYFTLFSLVEGMENIKKHSEFNSVDCVFELDDSFKCFSENSRQFKSKEKLPVSKEFTKDFCTKYGNSLFSDHCLGYKDSQLLLGFSHNTPDNTLPIIWGYDNGWTPIFKRHHKISF